MLYPLLGFKDDEFPAGLGWHDRVVQGVPRLALWALGRALNERVEDVAALVGVPETDLVWGKRKELLSWEVSSQLYRIALALHRLYPVLPSHDIAANWLKGNRKELDGLVPIRLLLTQPGAEAVYGVISRIAAVKAIPRSVVAPDADENGEPIESSDEDDAYAELT